MNFFKLKNITFKDGQYVSEWSFDEIKEDEIRTYYRPIMHDQEFGGCDFYCVQWTGNDAKYDCWNDPNVTVECLVNGTITWDGMRHLYFGDEQTQNEGYLYYQDPQDIILVMHSLINLEQKFCPEHGRPKRSMTDLNPTPQTPGNIDMN